jgi:hypothetical protein
MQAGAGRPDHVVMASNPSHKGGVRVSILIMVLPNCMRLKLLKPPASGKGGIWGKKIPCGWFTMRTRCRFLPRGNPMPTVA